MSLFLKCIPSSFFLYVKWLALRQIGNRTRGRNILDVVNAHKRFSAAVKTSNGSIWPSFGTFAIERIFLQKISYLMSSTGYHFDIHILASTCCWNWHSTFCGHRCPPHRWAQVLGMTQRQCCYYIQMWGTRFLSLSVKLQFLKSPHPHEEL